MKQKKLFHVCIPLTNSESEVVKLYSLLLTRLKKIKHGKIFVNRMVRRKPHLSNLCMHHQAWTL